MAKASSVVAVLLVFLILQVDFYAESSAVSSAIDCPSKCAYRCSMASRHKMCIRACNTCCKRCNCVPPGTSGNEYVCPCYAQMKTHGGRHKCP